MRDRDCKNQFAKGKMPAKEKVAVSAPTPVPHTHTHTHMRAHTSRAPFGDSHLGAPRRAPRSDPHAFLVSLFYRTTSRCLSQRRTWMAPQACYFPSMMQTPACSTWWARSAWLGREVAAWCPRGAGQG